MAACYGAYIIFAAFGHWMMVIPGISITVWPPNGVILAMLLIHPRQTWPWWVAVGATGELTGNIIFFDNSAVPALGYIVANTSAVTAAAFSMTPFLHAPVQRLRSLPQVLVFLGIGVLAAPAISATIGSAIDAAIGKNAFSTTWPLWWLGDATGILIATPLIISVVNSWREAARPSTAQVLEAATIALVLAALSAWQLSTGADYAFLLPLPILWAALRFEFRGATLAVLGLAIAIGIHAQNIYAAPVAASGSVLFYTKLQALLVVGASTGLIIAAIIRQQRQAVSGLARANDELEARVLERSRAIEAAERRFKATFQNAGVGISIVNSEGILLRVNESMAQFLGYKVEEMEGHTLDQFTHPEDVAEGEKALSRIMSGAAEDYELEKRYIGKDGEVLWGHTTVSCVRDADGQIDYLIKVIQNITTRKSSEEARQMLAREVHHRGKNLLTIVQVIARHTAARSPQDFVTTFGERLRALAANQDILVNSGWRRVEITDLVRSQVDHFGTTGSRIVLCGPRVTVPPAIAQALSMALHELATNAAKYGSLSNDTGLVAITWEIEDDTFHMSWRETGGPEVALPQATGFGTIVLDTMTASSMSGDVSIDYGPEGIIWRLRCPLSALNASQTVDASE